MSDRELRQRALMEVVTTKLNAIVTAMIHAQNIADWNDTLHAMGEVLEMADERVDCLTSLDELGYVQTSPNNWRRENGKTAKEVIRHGEELIQGMEKALIS